MKLTARHLVRTLLVVNALFIGVIFYLAPRTVMRVRLPEETSQLPVLAEPSPFSFVRENSTTFSSKDLKGHVWAADFIFTRCPNQCPAMSFRFAALQKTLPKNAKLISFSVDPQYDSPQRLTEYAKRFSADPEKWVFVTGDETAVHKLQQELKLTAPGEQEPGLHSLRFVLLDEKGRARGFYDSEDAGSLDKLNKDLRSLGGTK